MRRPHRSQSLLSGSAMQLFRNANHQRLQVQNPLEAPRSRRGPRRDFVLSSQEIRQFVQRRGNRALSANPEFLWIECFISLAETAVQRNAHCNGARAGSRPNRVPGKQQDVRAGGWRHRPLRRDEDEDGQIGRSRGQNPRGAARRKRSCFFLRKPKKRNYFLRGPQGNDRQGHANFVPGHVHSPPANGGEGAGAQDTWSLRREHPGRSRRAGQPQRTRRPHCVAQPNLNGRNRPSVPARPCVRPAVYGKFCRPSGRHGRCQSTAGNLYEKSGAPRPSRGLRRLGG